MTVTTIKVDLGLRDELKAQARVRGRTLGEHLQALADDEARRQRFEAVRRAMASSPIDAAYVIEAHDWSGDGWS